MKDKDLSEMVLWAYEIEMMLWAYESKPRSRKIHELSAAELDDFDEELKRLVKETRSSLEKHLEQV